MALIVLVAAVVIAGVTFALVNTGGDTHRSAPATRPDQATGPDRTPSAEPAAPPGGPWILRFADDFNSDRLDASRWNSNWLGPPGTTTPPVNESERANYAPASVTVSGGYLRLAAVRQPSVAGGQTRPYTSGLINTHGLFQFSYGYAEARIYVPGVHGKIFNWPAFWTVGNGPWPDTGENDIFEAGFGRAHWHYRSGKIATGAIVPGDFTGWHVFASDWEPGSVIYYYDGVEVGRVTKGVVSSPMYLIINLAVGGVYSGPVSLPSTVLVAYVRVWQH